MDSLTAQADRLEKSFRDSNHAYLLLVLVTALFVFFTFVAQWIASRKSGELDSVRKRIIAEKDAQLKDEFAHRDERIAQVHADADLKISHVQAESDQKIAAANKRSDEISARANRDAELLKAQNLETESKLEAEKAKRVELETSLTPRVLSWERVGGKSNIDKLLPFKGTKVMIEALPNAEVERAAGSLWFILDTAKWNVSGTLNRELNEPRFDGVILKFRIYPGPYTAESLKDKAEDAADELATFLRSYKWEVREEPVFPKQHNEIEANTIKIIVGFKPSPYFLSPEFKELRQRTEEMMRRMHEMKEERREYKEELRKQLPPETPKPE